MKFAKYIFFVIALIAISCEDKLELQPAQSLATEESLSDVKGMLTALYGAYDMLQDLNIYGRDYIVMAELEADLVYLSLSNSNRYVQNYTFLWTPDNANITAVWNDYYTVILRCNNIINNIDKIEGDAAEKNQIKGEALAIRALSHFDLVRVFAKQYTQSNPTADLGVPVVLESKIDEPTRNTIAEVYNQITSDLEATKGLLTDKGKFRFGPDAANALLSRVYLYKGDYANAEKFASDVINTNKYAIADDIIAAFKAPGSSEEIFTLKFTASETRGSDNLGRFFNPSGYGDARVATDCISLYEPSDKRLGFIYKHTNNQMYTNKFFAQDGVDGLFSPKILRISEMYLTRAEARAKQNKFADAIADLNAIRAKRSASALAGIADADVFQTVLDERRRELAFEGHTKFDLWRNGLDMVRNQCNTGIELDAPCNLAASSNLRVYPIPTREIDVNQNMVQNSGY
ncbi:MAG: RagB/SusD family nutrient uptake outer membrane protein [Saprospiraceae bacterium]|nr:RagB/SusD family nutrient uptake outer membrane protein [Saprospiraceae bacterium]